METAPTPGFLEVPTLLERSRPTPRTPWFWYGMGAAFLILAVTGTGAAQSGPAATAIELLGAMLFFVLMAGSIAITWVSLSRHRQEQRQLDAVEELIQLRRWTDAAGALHVMTSEPMRLYTSWVRALVYVATVLNRYHRFADAITVQDFVLGHAQLDPAAEYSVKVARAMAMLREDHLLDADRAIVELRRMSAAGQSAGALALVEMFRDVKTGHPAEAIEIFRKRLVAMREQLGQRVADAYALVAQAFDASGRPDEARGAWLDATTLAPAMELTRRYPEVGGVARKYPAAAVPAATAA